MTRSRAARRGRSVVAGLGRPSLTRAYEAAVAAVLARDSAATGVRLFALMRARGYAGQKSAAYAMVRRVRGDLVRFPVARPPRRVEGLS